MKRITFACLLILLRICLPAQQQHPPFWNEIQQFKKKDSVSMPAPHSILLIGSSSFTKWQDVQEYFPGYPMLNRGFGGSSLPDVIRYVPDIVFPYQPRQILIYCGENDLAGSDTTVNGQIVFNRFKQLYTLLRARYPNIPIGYVSMKPSPSRVHLLTKMKEGNRLIKNFLKKQRKASFIDVYDKMLNEDGSFRTEIYVSDNLHMNEKGYQIWQTIIQPYLLK